MVTDHSHRAIPCRWPRITCPHDGGGRVGFSHQHRTGYWSKCRCSQYCLRVVRSMLGFLVPWFGGIWGSWVRCCNRGWGTQASGSFPSTLGGLSILILIWQFPCVPAECLPYSEPPFCTCKRNVLGLGWPGVVLASTFPDCRPNGPTGKTEPRVGEVVRQAGSVTEAPLLCPQAGCIRASCRLLGCWD